MSSLSNIPGLTVEELREIVDYNPRTGKFYRGLGPGFGKELGCAQTRGYLKFMINGRPYLAHRLAWFYVHGVWPPEVVDHINGDTADNRIDNLRAVSQRENMKNTKRYRHLAGVLT